MDITCPKCGYHREVAEEKLPARAQMATCPKCKHKFQFRELPTDQELLLPEKISPESGLAAKTGPAPEEKSSSQPQGSSQEQIQKSGKDFWEGLEDMGARQEIPEHEPVLEPEFFPPWESIRQHGLLTAFFQTLTLVLFHPIRFFQSMRHPHGLLTPLFFYLIIVVIQLLTGFLTHGTETVNLTQGRELLGAEPITVSPAQMLFFYPLVFACSQFFVAGLNHLFLSLTGGTIKNFASTFRVACYGNAPFIFSSLLPGAEYIAATWSLICIILGYKYVHSISMLRSTLAVFFPLFLATALLLLFIRSAGVV